MPATASQPPSRPLPADALAQPTGRLLWAGEAASDKPATVLGAFLSGQREAGRLRGLLGLGGAPAA